MGLTEKAGPVEILSINGGKRVTDAYQVFPKLEKREDDGITCRFFLHGRRFVDESAQNRIDSLDIEEDLKIQLEPDNPVDTLALKILTGDGCKIGYAPRHLNKDLFHVVQSQQDKSLSIIQINKQRLVPSNQRVLIEMKGSFADHMPMESEELQPLVEFPQKLIKSIVAPV